jgi:hypothetical protein
MTADAPTSAARGARHNLSTTEDTGDAEVQTRPERVLTSVSSVSSVVESV